MCLETISGCVLKKLKNIKSNFEKGILKNRLYILSSTGEKTYLILQCRREGVLEFIAKSKYI